MAEREEEELQMALRMSLQGSPPPPEAKRSKQREVAAEESPEARNRRVQRELIAAAAEKRIRAAESRLERPVQAVVGPSAAVTARAPLDVAMSEASGTPEKKAEGEESGGLGSDSGEKLSVDEASRLFSMVFGSRVQKDILAQWSNQGIRFSSDPETCMGLVQHEGGPCGVLAALQAFILKYLLFFPDELGIALHSLGRRISFQSPYAAMDAFASITEERKARALVLSMIDILFLCGNKRRAVVATLSVSNHHSGDVSEEFQKNEVISKALDSLLIESASDLQKVLRVKTYTSQMSAFNRLTTELPVLRSRMGAMLFLISALLSRGLEFIQADRDDPSLPLVTAPFGHASQEIVNLLLCGQAVPNVFDGRMDLGGGMFLKGIPTRVEVGFLTLLESLNFCKVGQYLKCPEWPIWVVGSESHYTVLFALDTTVQNENENENELEEQESKIKKAFDAQDQSGGGGFISVEGFHQVLRQTNINFPQEKIDSLCFSGIIVWSEFWQALLELDKSLGGLKDLSGLMGKKQFDVYHFNGIAKSVLNGNGAIGSESPLQRPRLCKLRVSVPPKWTPDEFLVDVVPASSSDLSRKDGGIEVNQLPEPPQHAPLVDCIRTRWPRAICSWVGDAPSIV